MLSGGLERNTSWHWPVHRQSTPIAEVPRYPHSLGQSTSSTAGVVLPIRSICAQDNPPAAQRLQTCETDAGPLRQQSLGNSSSSLKQRWILTSSPVEQQMTANGGPCSDSTTKSLAKSSRLALANGTLGICPTLPRLPHAQPQFVLRRCKRSPLEDVRSSTLDIFFSQSQVMRGC